ncbi:hypothetical protein [Candidatus Manganitrophus noduliformans]|uniref:Uncharacterized protein n=1 Tax=Candidatus Manganitrophus noduliformans TaxID=2606439 RepID=A0A7X6DTC8_9BACT|nr:hypothetical protein [Candidatus Manganitrophus noduliformans]NKE72892.1 hypothetical protein [Candidatus Manganitrophus noduliformans]
MTKEKDPSSETQMKVLQGIVQHLNTHCERNPRRSAAGFFKGSPFLLSIMLIVAILGWISEAGQL